MEGAFDNKLWGAAICLTAAAVAAIWVLARASKSAWLQGKQLVGARTDAELEQLFVFVGAQRLLRLAVITMLLVAVVAWLIGVPLMLVPLFAVAGAGIPRAMAWGVRQRRRRRLCQQLPDALSLWAGLLQSGLGVAPALQQVANRQAAPLGEELRLLISQQRIGLPMEAAFHGLQERTGLQDLRMLATLLHINREVGGNLAESLLRLSELLARRLVMEARIAALTAQGKLQGWVVGALPLLLIAALYVMEPEAMRMLHTTWQGWAAITVVLILEIVGFLIIRRIVRIDV